MFFIKLADCCLSDSCVVLKFLDKTSSAFMPILKL